MVLHVGQSGTKTERRQRWMRRRRPRPAMRTWKVIYRGVWRRGYGQVSSSRGVKMPDGKYIDAKWCAEEATELVMKLQNEGKGDRELLRAVALRATAVIKLAKKEA
ncbi:MAG TPA: hypothetical protein VG224_00390 [Reyranella sp.]|nr:hypothetical protein [Reyranella sp.]